MRWFWFDRFVEFEPGRRAVAIKNVSLAEDHLHDHFPELPLMPASLMIEGMAQTAGILVGHADDFRQKVILAKIKKAAFTSVVQPGSTIRYEATIEQMTETGATTAGRISVDGEPIGEVDLVFSHIDQNLGGQEFPEENFVFTEDFKSLLRGFQRSGAARIGL